MGQGNKKYYWIKLKTDFFDLPTIDWLQDQENGCEYIVLYQKLCLLAANSDGKLVRNIGPLIVPYDVKKIAELTRFSFDTVAIALELYKKIGMIIEQENGILCIPGIGEMVGSETKWAQKKRLQRAKKRNLLTNLNEDETEDKSGTMSSNEGTLSISMSNGGHHENFKKYPKEDNVPAKEGHCLKNEGTLSDKRSEIRDIKPATTIHMQTEYGEVVRCYQNNIRPVCNEIESQKLYDMVEHYGKDTVLRAIERAVMRGGRTLSYINGILQSWEQHGYDEEGAMHDENRTNAARRRNNKPVRRKNSAVKGGVRTDWSDVPDGWV